LRANREDSLLEGVRRRRRRRRRIQGKQRDAEIEEEEEEEEEGYDNVTSPTPHHRLHQTP
jgi:hypothetical protein